MWVKNQLCRSAGAIKVGGNDVKMIPGAGRDGGAVTLGIIIQRAGFTNFITYVTAPMLRARLADRAPHGGRVRRFGGEIWTLERKNAVSAVADLPDLGQKYCLNDKNFEF